MTKKRKFRLLMETWLSYSDNYLNQGSFTSEME